MAENIYERIHRTLTWKRIAAFNALLFMVTVVPISVRLAQQDTENRSGAAGELPTPSVTPQPNYPQGEPRIDRVTEFFGKKGDTVVVLGANFGDFKWGSKLFVGNVEAEEANVVRWSNNVIEVQIPESARTGKVWVVINGRQAQWEGSLLLYDVSRSAQVGIKRENSTSMTVWLIKAQNVTRGMIELAHVSEPLSTTVVSGAAVSQVTTADALGKKTQIEFALDAPLSSNNTNIMRLDYPGIGAVEILRAELYDQNGNMVSVYADPFTVKVR